MSARLSTSKCRNPGGGHQQTPLAFKPLALVQTRYLKSLTYLPHGRFRHQSPQCCPDRAPSTPEELQRQHRQPLRPDQTMAEVWETTHIEQGGGGTSPGGMSPQPAEPWHPERDNWPHPPQTMPLKLQNSDLPVCNTLDTCRELGDFLFVAWSFFGSIPSRKGIPASVSLVRLREREVREVMPATQEIPKSVM